jgi:hypothetical protein
MINQAAHVRHSAFLLAPQDKTPYFTQTKVTLD